MLLLIGCILSLTIYAQNHVCGTYDGYLQDEMNKYPDFYNSLHEKNQKLSNEASDLLLNVNEKQNPDDVKIIPVVVHIIHDLDQNGVANITDNDVHYALEQLNKNINRRADNMSTTPDVFAAVSGSANVEFRLAKIDPNGNHTNGIVRVFSELTEVPVNEAGNNIVKTLSYWNSFSYFNIWVISNFPPQSDGNTLLGYAQFPWSGSMSTDGVAIKASEFKNGRTLTHEAGHWLGLRHVWGDALCGDDGVSDTPVAKEENWGVQISDFPHNLNVCEADSINPSGEMFMNYMDYSPDNVMSLFTDGQVEIMNEHLEGTTDRYGFRRYLWSDTNLYRTGTKDGYVGTHCHKEVDFIEEYGATSPCLGDLNVLRGNKNIFNNITSMTWDWGDGTIDVSQDNTPQHAYTAAGNYDVKLSITYNDEIVVKAFSLEDIDEASASNVEHVVETRIIEGTMAELNDVNAINVELVLDLDSFSSGSYWVYNQPTDSVAGASTSIYLGVDTFLLTTVVPEGQTLDSALLAHYQSAYSYSTLDSTLFNGDVVTYHYAEFIDDAYDAYFIDTLFYRGSYEASYYLATYTSTCTAELIKTDYINVVGNSATNTNNSYVYSFEDPTDFQDNFIMIDNALVSDWDFNVSANPEWVTVDTVASDGNSSLMLNGKKLTSANPIIFETEAYDLSDLTQPAIKLDFIGAGINSSPSNYLTIYYSTDCGIWKELKEFSPARVASAGYYSTAFDPAEEGITQNDWNSVVLYDQVGANDLKSSNVRFRFEYSVFERSNRLYIDNIRIGEATSLLSDVSYKRLISLFPNPADQNVSVTFVNDIKQDLNIKVYNILGSEVAHLFRSELNEGTHYIYLDLNGLEEGVYLVSFIGDGYVLETKRLIIQN